MTSQVMNDLLKIVSGLLSRKESGIFREPVDYKGLGLTDYTEIVKEPRDLGTIKKKIEDGKYKDPESVAEDIRLVWSNCMLYNRDGSEYYHLADKFAKAFEESYSVFTRLNKDEDMDRLPTVEERLRLSYDIFKIDNLEMAHALTIIEEDCEAALVRKPDDLLINFDALKPRCFHRLNKFVCKALLESNTKKNKSVKKRPADTPAATAAASKKKAK